MIITMRPTETVTTLDGVPCRLWSGRTDTGAHIDVFVHRVGAAGAAADELARALGEMPPPRNVPLLDAIRQQDRAEIARLRETLVSIRDNAADAARRRGGALDICVAQIEAEAREALGGDPHA